MSGRDKTLDLLTLLASRPGGFSFGQIREQGYTAPTLSRLLKSLNSRGMVDKNQDGTYQLGEGARVLARAILGLSSREEKISSLLKSLAERTGESAAFYEKAPRGIRLIGKEEMPESFHYISLGSCNYQEKHGFFLVLEKDFPPGKVIHEVWETAAGFDRLAMAVEAPFSGSLGITFSRGRHGADKIEEFKRILEELVPKAAL